MMKSGLFVGLLLMVVIGGAVAPTYAQTSLPAGDAKAGAVVFKRCMGCHQIGPDAMMGVGPALNGVVGRSAATAPGYDYSATRKKAGLVWDEPTLTDFLRAPAVRVSGTRMTFPGLGKNQEIADVIAYLRATDPQE